MTKKLNEGKWAYGTGLIELSLHYRLKNPRAAYVYKHCIDKSGVMNHCFRLDRVYQFLLKLQISPARTKRRAASSCRFPSMINTNQVRVRLEHQTTRLNQYLFLSTKTQPQQVVRWTRERLIIRLVAQLTEKQVDVHQEQGCSKAILSFLCRGSMQLIWAPGKIKSV